MSLHVTMQKNAGKHYEGEIWEESGKTWTIKNGIKRTVTKMDEARKELLVPLACPSCGKPMKHHLDEKMWAINKTCFNCLIDMEHEIIKAGKWEEYEKNKILANANQFVKDLKDYLADLIVEDTSKNLVTEDGIVEKWKGADPTAMKELNNSIIDTIEKNIDNYKNT